MKTIIAASAIALLSIGTAGAAGLDASSLPSRALEGQLVYHTDGNRAVNANGNIVSSRSAAFGIGTAGTTGPSAAVLPSRAREGQLSFQTDGNSNFNANGDAVAQRSSSFGIGSRQIVDAGDSFVRQSGATSAPFGTPNGLDYRISVAK